MAIAYTLVENALCSGWARARISVSQLTQTPTENAPSTQRHSPICQSSGKNGKRPIIAA